MMGQTLRWKKVYRRIDLMKSQKVGLTIKDYHICRVLDSIATMLLINNSLLLAERQRAKKSVYSSRLIPRECGKM